MTSFDSLDSFFRKVDLILEQLRHLDIRLPHVCDRAAFVRLTDSLHKQVRAVVARQVFSLQQGLSVALLGVAIIGLTGPLEARHRQLFLDESTVQVLLNAIETAFGRFA